jgi:hypothetical protein
VETADAKAYPGENRHQHQREIPRQRSIECSRGREHRE